MHPSDESRGGESSSIKPADGLAGRNGLKSRYTEEQIVGILKESKAGMAARRSYAGSTV